MDALLAFTIIFVIYSIGDIIAVKTKAIVSMLVFASIVYLVGFNVGLPKTIFADSVLMPLSGVIITILLVHMGTTMSFKEFIRQWKTVIISVAAVLGMCIFLVLLASPFIGREYAIMGAPILSGAVVANIIMSEAANAKGLTDLAVYGTMILVLQGFFGYPVASLCLKSEAQRLMKLHRGGTSQAIVEANPLTAEKPKWRIFPQFPSSYNTSAMVLAKLGIIALLSTWLSKLTNGNVNKLVICLILGVVFKELGFLDTDALNKANSFGLVIGAATLAVFGNLVNATPELLIQQVQPILVLLVVGIFGMCVGSIVVGKFLGYSWQMSLALGSTSLFGFPGTFILSNEVSNAAANNDEERQIILDNILPKMLVAGMVTVSISSVLIAGVMAKML